MKIKYSIFLFSLLLFLNQAFAEIYPNKPIHLIVPFAPSGFTDIVARVLGQKLAQLLNQQVVIENKSGAGSTIGTDYVAKSAPDGYTLVMVSTTHTITPFIYKKIPYDPIKSFTAISMLAESAYVLVVNSNLPIYSVKDYINASKLNPNSIRYASSGNGSSQHLMGGLFSTLANIKIQHVPYKGSSSALTDLIGGVVESSFAGTSNVLQQIQNGKLRALGVTTSKRVAQLPDVPTIQESGLATYDASVWLALLAPKDTPKSIVDKLNLNINIALNSIEVKKILLEAGIETSPSTPENLSSFMAQELDRWGHVVKDAGLSLE
jgi:tripartite-type tricarboxylate transporter receptor subunit TctC